MIGKAIRITTLLLATPAILAAVLAAPLPASAADSGSMCEAYGNYCLNTANFDLYTPVTESGSGARTITAVLQNSNQQTYLLQFKGATSKCVASDNSGMRVEIKACNGSNGVLWTRWSSNGVDMWLNNYSTGLLNNAEYLSGINIAGTQYLLQTQGTYGSLERFYFS